MKIIETANALALAQAFDRRTVGEGDIRAWHAIIGDADADDVMEAIRRHYAEQTDWIMPAHIRRIIRDIHRERAVAANPWAPGQHGVRKADAAPELEHGVRLTADDVSPAVLEVLSQLRNMLPDGDRAKLFPRQAYWEREQRAYQRADGGQPNPAYRPSAADEALRADCRANGPHDSGLHVVGCPDAGLPLETFQG